MGRLFCYSVGARGVAGGDRNGPGRSWNFQIVRLSPADFIEETDQNCHNQIDFRRLTVTIGTLTIEPRHMPRKSLVIVVLVAMCLYAAAADAANISFVGNGYIILDIGGAGDTFFDLNNQGNVASRHPMTRTIRFRIPFPVRLRSVWGQVS